ENWYIDTRSAQARYEAALQQLESAQLTDELTNERFRIGYINPLELLSSHSALTEARHTLLQAKYMTILGKKMIEYYRTANVTLN
ncbi:MAG: TolC family protein, partial [Paramuribaculum sp.]|nr:TolC family protein [Paramuribaculum sp.]